MTEPHAQPHPQPQAEPPAEPLPAIVRQRLHPLSPVLKGLRLFALAVVAISWRGLEQLGVLRWLGLVVILFIGVLIYSSVVWRFTGYEVSRRELRIYEGLLSRRIRTVPLERLQAIEVVQPFQARPFGLAELKLDVAGAEKSEAPLAFLPLGQALELRGRLLALASGTTTATPVEETHSELHRVANNNVMVSQFLTPPVMFTPLAVLYIAGQLVFNQEFGFFAVASMLSAMFATVGTPIMRTLNFWNFRLDRTDSGKLRIRHGLLNTRSQVVPIHRIQSLTLTWPRLWRGKGWLRVTLAVAGQSSAGTEGGKAETDRLLPVARLETVRAVMPNILPGFDPMNLPLTPVPRQARWLAPLRAKILAAGLTDQVFGSVDGLMTRTLTVVSYGRIQSVRITQGPWQRRLGLATVHADVAGGIPVSASHRLLPEAYAWAGELARRALIARGEATPMSVKDI